MDSFDDSEFASMTQAMQEEEAQSHFQSKFWSPKTEGLTQVRFISPLKDFGEKIFYMKYRQHYVNGHPYFCLNQTLVDKNGKVHEAETCPICKKVKQLYALSSDKESEEARLGSQLSAKDRFVSRIIVRGKKDSKGVDSEAKPEFYEFGKKIHEILANAIKLGEYGNFLSLKSGRDFNLSKKGTGRNTDYSGSQLSIKQTPVFTDIEKIKVLAEELKKMDYKQLVEFKSSEELEKALAEYLNDDADAAEVESPRQSVGEPISDQVKSAVSPKAESAEPSASESDDDLEKALAEIG